MAASRVSECVTNFSNFSGNESINSFGNDSINTSLSSNVTGNILIDNYNERFPIFLNCTPVQVSPKTPDFAAVKSVDRNVIPDQSRDFVATDVMEFKRFVTEEIAKFM